MLGLLLIVLVFRFFVDVMYIFRLDSFSLMFDWLRRVLVLGLVVVLIVFWF